MCVFQVRWSDPVSVHLDSLGATLHSNPPPASGAIMAGILNILDNYNIGPEDDTPLLYHRMTEAFKWAYAQRTELGDSLGDPDIADIVNSVVRNITSEEWALRTFRNISGLYSVQPLINWGILLTACPPCLTKLFTDTMTVDDPSEYGAVYYSPTDHGTAHISVLAANGDAVSATSTINL